MSNSNYNTKDIFLQRRTSNGTFEEYPLAVMPDSIVTANSYSSLVLVSTSSFSASYAKTSSYSLSASSFTFFNITQSTLNTTQSVSSSWASSSISSSYALLSSNSISASYASTSSMAINFTASNIKVTNSEQQGSSVVASGQYSHAEGSGTIASGFSSHAEGLDTIAGAIAFFGDYSHAEGRQTITNEAYSHAEGQQTVTNGVASHAEGLLTTTLGAYSHAEGHGTISSGSYQLVVGQYNTQGNTSSLFVIGNGGSPGNRSDLALFNSQSIIFNKPLTSSLFGTASYANTSSNLNGFTFQNASVLTNVTSSNFVILQSFTGSYLSAFFNYVVTSGSNLRVGIIFGGWNGSNLTFSELTTTHLGNTSDITMSMDLSASNVRFLSFASSSLNWTVRIAAQYI